MRCKACDTELTDFEATRKYVGTNDFVDLCRGCVDPDGQYHERFDLLGKHDIAITTTTEDGDGEEM